MISNASDRAVVVHCHIFKNAGSTFDWSLKRNFGSDFFEYRMRRARPLTAEMLARIVAENPGVRAISGHGVALPLAPIPGHVLLPALFIRHPVERAYSVYTFERHQSEDTRGSLMARKQSFAEYVAWRLTPESPAILRNYQTRYCSGMLGKARLPVTGTQFKSAMDIIARVELLGVVDDYDRCMVLFEQVLARHGLDSDLRYLHQNAGRYVRGRKWGVLGRVFGSSRELGPFQQIDRGADATARRAAWVLEQLGSELAACLVEANQYDLKLYEEVRQRIRRCAEGLGDIQERIASFRVRCGELAQGRKHG